MDRQNVAPRPGWRAKCEAVGFRFHSEDGVYWDESACYRFTPAEVDTLEAATAELHQMCLCAVERAVAEQQFDRFALSPAAARYASESWRRRDPSLFGRFDLRYDGCDPPKLLEYNADTPTSLLEASVVQWHWLNDVRPGADQFNSLHEKLIARWKSLLNASPAPRLLYFASVRDSLEDTCNVDYLMDTAAQAGAAPHWIAIEDIGWDRASGNFVDLENQAITTLFKLYPWEWLTGETFGPALLSSTVTVFEPPWKMFLSNKAILPLLWEMFPDHPNLLPAYRDEREIAGPSVKKPLFAREGANITVRSGDRVLTSDDHGYGAEGAVYQAFEPLPDFGGGHMVIGSWIIGNEPAGVGIREDRDVITRNTSRFVPHYFE